LRIGAWYSIIITAISYNISNIENAASTTVRVDVYGIRTRRLVGLLAIVGLIALLILSTSSIAQEVTRSEGAVARQLQNPLANFNLLGLQTQSVQRSSLDWYKTGGSLLPVQQMLPPAVNSSLGMISQAYPLKRGADGHGLGGISVSALVAPANIPTIAWGLGPALSQNNAAGSNKWGTGASGAVVYSVKAWVGGVFISNMWSFEGDTDRDHPTNQMIVQPFLNYNLSKGWYLTSAPAISVNWHANSNNAFTVPVGGGVGKVVSVYGQMLNIAAQGYVYPVHPTPGTGWAVQTTLQWLFPN
jgi:hypothetical protein